MAKGLAQWNEDHNFTLNIDNSVVTVDWWSLKRDSMQLSAINSKIVVLKGNTALPPGGFHGGGHNYAIVKPASTTVADIVENDGGHINLLNLSSSNELVLTPGESITLDSIIIPTGSSCTNYYKISSTYVEPSGQVIYSADPIIFNLNQSSLAINYVQINNVQLLGPTLVSPLNCAGFGDVTGWNLGALPPPTDYYWIGGSGNWSDPSHWSDSSEDLLLLVRY